MFTTAWHRTHSQILLGTLLLLSGLVHGQAFAQEVPAGDAIAKVSPYKIEGIPGGPTTIGDFVVGPGKVDLTLSPGESKTVEMTVTNRTGETRIFNISSEDAMGSNDTETSIVLLGDDRGPYSMKDYVSVPAVSFTLDQNTRARIPVTISIPADAEPGGLYGSVLIDTLAIEGDTGETTGTAPQSAVIARIGTLFFITIPGVVEKDGALKDFSTIGDKKFYQNSPVDFGILFENKGSIHLAPYGELRIKNMFGEEVGQLQLEPWFVLPESTRLREVSWSREFLFGMYTATVYVNRSYDDAVDEMSFTFWVLPWKPIVSAFGVLFLVFFTIRAFFRTFEFKRKE